MLACSLLADALSNPVSGFCLQMRFQPSGSALRPRTRSPSPGVTDAACSLAATDTAVANVVTSSRDMLELIKVVSCQAERREAAPSNTGYY